MEIKSMYKIKILLFWRFHRTSGLFLCKQKHWPKKVRRLKYLVWNYCTLCNENGNASEKQIVIKKKVWLCYIKLTADPFSTHFCLDRCNWETMKSLEIKSALFCELSQKTFCFKDVRCELSSLNVRKFWNFLFYCIINMKNIIIKILLSFVCWHIFILNSDNLFVIYLDYKKTLKIVRDKTKMIFRRQKKVKIKYISMLKIE